MLIKRFGLYSAWLLATLGMLGSLYFSEIKSFEPCHLCWYQRIALFPLFIILGIATYRGFLNICVYVLPLAIIGLLFAFYQIAIQEIPGWNPIDMCGSGPSCAEKISIGLGLITLPMLSAINFFLITLILLIIGAKEQTHKKPLEN